MRSTWCISTSTEGLVAAAVANNLKKAVWYGAHCSVCFSILLFAVRSMLLVAWRRRDEQREVVEEAAVLCLILFALAHLQLLQWNP